jgi:DNA-binding MarR family transcriptional regulator
LGEQRTIPTKMLMDKSDYELLAAFRFSLRRFLRSGELRANEVGLTPQQYQALLAIQGFPGRAEASIGEIAERVQCRHHSTVELIDRLEARSLVCRRADPDNRRRVCVALTEQGKDVLERVAAGNKEELRRLAPEIIGTLRSLVYEEWQTGGAEVAAEPAET